MRLTPTPFSILPFRFLDTAPARGAWNMALDEALMDSVRAGAAPVLRLYRWEPACLSFGRNQPARGRYDLGEIERLGLDVVRRATGGRAVVHARELTYSVVVDDRRFGGARQSYSTINRALVEGLRRLGVPAALQPAGAGRAAVPSTRPCFEEPAAGEVVVAGRKLVGSAQVRERGILLQHGSLLLEDDQSLLSTLLGEASGPPAPAPAALSEYLSPLPSWDELRRAIVSGWAEVVGSKPIAAEPGAAELEGVEQVLQKHLSLEWIWRR